ncbi:hypothetical protein, partial [Salmonella enterica]|uniref:hypothetical protein n=1 Tax=Salmonella enterica TaxID=28901 RepID=UPI003D2CE169
MLADLPAELAEPLTAALIARGNVAIPLPAAAALAISSDLVVMTCGTLRQPGLTGAAEAAVAVGRRLALICPTADWCNLPQGLRDRVY